MSQGKRHRQRLGRTELSANGYDILSGNRISLLQNGQAYFPAIVAAFDRACHEIYLETYIYEDDAVGKRIAETLKRAVQRGVTVHVLIDGYGSKNLPRCVLDDLQTGGVKTLIYRPKISPWTFRRRRLRRMHRKVVVVDREIAFVGGINIIADSASPSTPPRYDYAVVVEGPLVDVIRLSSQQLWSAVSWRHFRKRKIRGGTLPVSTFTGGYMRAAFLLRNNYHHRRDIEAAYMQAIEGAKSEIILANAYFLPGLDFRHALMQAAGRGVRVVLLLQGKVEYLLEHYASRALYGNLLNAGIEIYEYRKSFLHAKVAVIDGHWATVGSSNIDPFSLLLSCEANVVVENETFGAALAQSLKKTVETDGCRILPDNWKQQPAGLRFISWLSYGLLRWMQGISGYARKDSTS
ncbi:MAG: cardiolipin synthase ClsB [Kiritimatiellae bacterium]|jgi:cardiolipin synthase|nr:cardiolipin synthase ClsB [Kiritimatiellia bacterium]